MDSQKDIEKSLAAPIKELLDRSRSLEEVYLETWTLPNVEERVHLWESSLLLISEEDVNVQGEF